MANVAAQSLSALYGLQGNIAQAEDTDSALDRLEESTLPVGTQKVPDADEEKTRADFPLDKAAAAAIAGSFILGPVGGVLLGGAVGFMERRAEQNILDQMAEGRNALNDGRQIVQNEIDTLRNSGTLSNEDMQALDAIEADLAFGYRMGSPDVMRQQLTELGNLVQANETQRIAAETLDDQNRRLLDSEQYSRYEKLQDDFSNDSATYMEVRRRANTARQALNSGTNSGQLAAIINFRKTLDPNSAVMNNEVEGTGDIASLAEALRGYEEKLRTGKVLTPTEARELFSAIDGIEGGYITEQRLLEARYYDQLDTAELTDERYGDRFTKNFRLTEDAPARINMNLAVLGENEDDVQSTTPVTDRIIETGSDAVDFLDRMMMTEEQRRAEDLKRFNESGPIYPIQRGGRPTL